MSGGGRRFLLLLIPPLVAGAWLRLDLLPSQILLDDEWHGLNQVVDRSLAQVLTTIDGRDNTSLPLNLYHWLLLRTAGWTELLIRLPALAAGIAAPFVLPLAVRRLAGDRTAILFAWLLSISPFLIFYSRFSRAYSIVALAAFLAIVFGRRWLAGGGRRDRAAFAAAGAAAGWFHPLGALAALAPLAAGLLGAWMPGAIRATPAIPAAPAPPTRREAAGTALLLGALLAPAAWIALTSPHALPWGEGGWSIQGAAALASLAAGTGRAPVAVTMFVAAILGARALAGRDPLLVALCGAAVASFVLVLSLARPFGLENGVVALRYMIVALPILLLLAAAGLADLAGRVIRFAPGSGAARAAFASTGAAVVAALFFAGPLPEIHRPPNNFTGHSAFQGSYEPPDRDRSDARHVYPGRAVSAEEVPGVYRLLRERPDIGAIVEYPLDIVNYNNLLYFHQFVHGKEVLAGYCADRTLLGHRVESAQEESDGGFRMGFLPADRILSRAPDPGMLRFRSMVDLTDPRAARAAGAGAVVVHRTLKALRFLPDGHGEATVVYRSSEEIARRCREAFGEPLYDDGVVVCFEVR